MTKQFKEQVQYIGNIVINHKVEQIVRAITVADDIIIDPSLINPRAMNHQLLHEQDPYTYVEVGIADQYGWRFTPNTNSVLAVLGYHANSLLFRLNSLVVEGVSALTEKDGKLIAPFAAVVHVAVECSFNTPYKGQAGTYSAVINNYNGYVRKFGHPKHFAVGVRNARNTIKTKNQKSKAVR